MTTLTTTAPAKVQAAAVRLAANNRAAKILADEIAADKALLKEWGEAIHHTTHGIVTVSPVTTTEVDPEVARELLGTRFFNSKVRSEKVDLSRWRNADIDEAVRAEAETAIHGLRVTVR